MAKKRKDRPCVKKYLGIDPVTGKRKYKSFTANTKREARRMADAYDPQQAGRNSLTVRQAIEKYASEREAVLSPTTINSINGCARNYFQDIMNLSVAEITIPVLQSSVNNQAKYRSERSRKPLSPKTIKSNLAIVTCALKYADIDLPYYKITTPQRQKIHYNTPDRERMKDILRVSRGTALEVPVLLAAWLSLRRGEICGLKWSDIDGNILHVRRTRVIVNGEEHIKSPKNTESERDIYIPNYIKERIAASKRITAHNPKYADLRNDSKYIVPQKPNTITEEFTRLLKRNNLPLCRFHDLRHAFASISHSLNIPDRYVEAMGGWSDDTTLKNVYQQTFRDDMFTYARQIESEYMTLIPS